MSDIADQRTPGPTSGDAAEVRRRRRAARSGADGAALTEPALAAQPASRPGIFTVERAAPRLDKLPKAPPPDARLDGLSALQIIMAILLAVSGLGVLMLAVTGVPLAAIGGKFLLAVPVLAILFLVRGGA